jgi:hypothetical protein
MHWTAFLAYRRFPANARVAENMACIGCGYNLRGLNVWIRCPECGSEVGNSLFLLARPEIVQRSLHTTGYTYFAPLALLLTCLTGAWWPALVAGGALFVAAVFRLFAVGQLRYRGALARLPVVGARLNTWWIVVVVELFLALSIIALVMTASAFSTSWGAGAQPIAMWLLAAAWLAGMGSAIAAGRFGHALVDMLEFTWTRIEFRVQNIATMLALFASGGLIVGMTFAQSTAADLVLLSVIGLITLAVAAMTGIALLHAANAAQQSQETVDEVLDSERVVVGPDIPPKPHLQQPSIPLEP